MHTMEPRRRGPNRPGLIGKRGGAEQTAEQCGMHTFEALLEKDLTGREEQQR
uniref:Uncharacterized protein n=1 Tax=Arundo donax TaxID=35708 RepID=A0A0A9HEY2_ARUDO